MSLSKLIQFWRELMTLKKRATDKKPPLREFPLELLPVFEDPALFQARKEEVQILLTDMFLRLYRRGRPRKEENENPRAA